LDEGARGSGRASSVVNVPSASVFDGGGSSIAAIATFFQRFEVPLHAIETRKEQLNAYFRRATLLHGSAAARIQLPPSTAHARRTYSGRPSSSMRLSEAAAMATSVVCRPPVRERSASPITRL